MRVLVIHGPNLNLLGRREPEIYGAVTLGEIDDHLRVRAAELDVGLTCFQSNGEGAIVDRIQDMVLTAPGEDALLINPAAYTHTSVAVRDAIAAVGKPAWEVHLSHGDTREPFRRVSLVRDVCIGCTQGRGAAGYFEALTDLVTHVRRDQEV